MAVSGGGCTVDDGVQYLGGGLSVQDFSWAALELVLDGLDLGIGDVGEVGALREVLADQAACVLVGGTLLRPERRLKASLPKLISENSMRVSKGSV